MSTMTLRILRQLLVKGVNLIDAEIKKEGEPGTCPHLDAAELQAMRMDKKVYICNDCGLQFTGEVDNEIPQTMGRRGGPGNGPGPRRAGTRA